MDNVVMIILKRLVIIFLSFSISNSIILAMEDFSRLICSSSPNFFTELPLEILDDIADFADFGDDEESRPFRRDLAWHIIRRAINGEDNKGKAYLVKNRIKLLASLTNPRAFLTQDDSEEEIKKVLPRDLYLNVPVRKQLKKTLAQKLLDSDIKTLS